MVPCSLKGDRLDATSSSRSSVLQYRHHYVPKMFHVCLCSFSCHGSVVCSRLCRVNVLHFICLFVCPSVSVSECSILTLVIFSKTAKGSPTNLHTCILYDSMYPCNFFQPRGKAQNIIMVELNFPKLASETQNRGSVA